MNVYKQLFYCKINIYMNDVGHNSVKSFYDPIS